MGAMTRQYRNTGVSPRLRGLHGNGAIAGSLAIQNQIGSRSGGWSGQSGVRWGRRASMVAGALLAYALPYQAAQAQELPTGVIDKMVDENGVNLSSGTLSISEPAIGLGDKNNGGLYFVRNYSSGWSHNYNYKASIKQLYAPESGTFQGDLSITGGEYRDDFLPEVLSGGSVIFHGMLGNGATLVGGDPSTSGVTYTSRDGAVVVFDKYELPGQDYLSYVDYGLSVASSVTKPNGEKLTLTYNEYRDNMYYNGYLERRRLSSIQSNFGYQIKLIYETNEINNNNHQWHRLKSIIIINNAIDYCDPAGYDCSGITQAWPRVDFTSTLSNLIETQTETYSTGEKRTYFYSYDGYGSNSGDPREFTSGGWLTSMGRGSPNITTADFGIGTTQYETIDNIFHIMNRFSVTTDNGISTYDADVDLASLGGMTVRKAVSFGRKIHPSGTKLQFDYFPYSGKPQKFTDENNRIWNFQYDAFDRLIYSVPPEGTLDANGVPTSGYIKYDYDARGNAVQTTWVAKSGSGLPNIVKTAGFDATCGNVKTCNKPNWTRDALAHQTDYTYDPNHGGLLSEMKPAPSAGAARPLTLNTYAQRSAWIKNAGGALVQSPDPVWLPSSTTICQTVAGSNSPACDPNAPQNVTTFEYGAAGTGEAMLVKGLTVTSGGVTLRTCYTYDVFHRRVSETSPRANRGNCS
jgi:hypothetical protein